MCSALADVCLVPKADSCSAAKRSLFDQRVGAQQELFRTREVNCLRSLEIDGQLELGGLLYRHVFRLLALQNSLHKLGAVPKSGRSISPKRQETSDIYKSARGRGRGHAIFDRHIGQWLDRQDALDDDRIRSLSLHGCKGTFEFVRSVDYYDWLYFCA